MPERILEKFMSVLTRDEFLQELEAEAGYQALLERRQLLPSGLSWLGRLVAGYPWQILGLVSFLSALVVQFLGGRPAGDWFVSGWFVDGWFVDGWFSIVQFLGGSSLGSGLECGLGSGLEGGLGSG